MRSHDVIVGQPMDQQERSFEVASEREELAGVVLTCADVRIAEVALGVVGVVK